MIWEARVPPDAGIKEVRKRLALLVRAGFPCSPVNVRELGMRIQRVRGFVFARMIINAGRLLCRASRTAARTIKHVNNVVPRASHLRLREVGKQMLVSTVAIYDDDFLATVARHFVRSFL